MALRRYHNDHLSYPTPYRGEDVRYPDVYRDYGSYSYRVREDEHRTRRSRYAYESRGQSGIKDLLDKSLDYHGDLGWTLEYATAWCYRYLVGNQTEVADVIDKVRTLEEAEPKTPYIIFDALDRAIFGGKLNGMVYLRWKAQVSCACGTTSAPGVLPGIPRICVELNRTPFEDGCADLDELLDVLIHQMIHAFFLVACGAQPKGAKQDGRLADGLHFGVILHTIKDMSRQCQDGPLPLIFYAETRRNRDRYHQNQSLNAYGDGAGVSQRRNQRSWVSIDPLGSVVAADPADGQSHCSHDNRSIRPAQVKNWQVEHYSRAIELAMDRKGDSIYDLRVDNKLVPTDRLKGPPSASYVELVWDKKYIIVPRENALKFSSIQKPLEKEKKFELKVPDCSMSVLRLLYDFLQYRVYWEAPADKMARSTCTRTRGPPVFMRSTALSMEVVNGMLDNIKVFKTAESMKFEELQSYALKRLYDMPSTCDDPVEALKELYNDGKDSGHPIHAELHKWARKFLARSEDHMSSNGYQSYGSRDMCRGTSNYEKLLHTYGDRFEELYYRNLALEDDCKIVHAELTANGMMGFSQKDHTLDYPRTVSTPCMPSANPIKPLLSRARSWSSRNSLGRRWTTPISSAAPSISDRSLDDMAISSTLPRPLLDWPTPTRLSLADDRVCYKYYGRDGRLKKSNPLTGERYAHVPFAAYSRDTWTT